MVFLCGVADLMMTAWRADAKMPPLQEKETEGEHLDIPGWKLATARKVPTEVAVRLKKSFCGLVNALLEWYLTERDPSSDQGAGSLPTKDKRRPRRWKRNTITTKAQMETVLGAVQYQGERIKDGVAAECGE